MWISKFLNTEALDLLIKHFMKIILPYFLYFLFSHLLIAQELKEVNRFKAQNATQAVAVDSQYVYSISNSRIEKHLKATGELIHYWEGPLLHLNSGIILDGKLYCAHTNFPQTPMASSVEIFDPVTMEHIGSHSFGIYIGSCTWLDWYEDSWYVMFVHYDEKGKERDLDAAYTTLVQFDKEWRRTGAWTVPKRLVDHLRPMSISGGIMDNGGIIYASPHHFNELYILKLPQIGFELEWAGTLAVPFLGQGIAWDRSEKGVIYGIHRRNREVIGISLPKK